MRAQPDMPTLRPDPIDGESRPGYLLRSLTINGRRLNRDTKHRHGLQMSAILSGADKDIVRRVTGVDLAVPNAHTVVAMTSRQVQFRGQMLHRDDFTTEVRRWCGACWREDLARSRADRRPRHWSIYRRSWYDVVAVRTCPKHAMRLSQDCPACSRPVSWRSGTLTRCGCGASLMTVLGEKVEPSTTAADAYILGRLGYLPLVSVEFLDGLCLRDAIDAMEQLGATSLGGAFGVLSHFDVDRHAEVASEGLRIAAGWPKTFEDLLAILVANGGGEHWGAGKIYGYLVNWSRKLEGDLGNKVREALSACHARNGYVHPKFMMATLATKLHYNLNDVIDEVGRSRSIVLAMLGELGLTPASSQKGIPFAIHVEDLARVRAMSADLIGFDELPDLLGASRDAVKILIGSGVLKPRDFQHDEAERYPLYSRCELTAFLQSVIGDVEVLDAVPADCKLLTRLSQQMRTGTIDVLVQAVRDRRLPLRGCLARPGLGSIVVSLDDFMTFKAGLLDATLSLADAGAIISLHPGTIGAAIDAGLIPSADTFGGRRRVERAALDAFRERFVTTSWLSSRLGIGHKAINGALAAQGLQPTLSRKADAACKTNIWERSSLPDVDALMLGRSPSNVNVSARREQARAEVTDDQWERLKGFFPRPSAKGGRAGLNDRSFVEAVVWLWREEMTWSHLPAAFGPWAVHYGRFHRWQRQDRWKNIARELAHLDEFRWLRVIDQIGWEYKSGVP